MPHQGGFPPVRNEKMPSETSSDGILPQAADCGLRMGLTAADGRQRPRLYRPAAHPGNDAAFAIARGRQRQYFALVIPFIEGYGNFHGIRLDGNAAMPDIRPAHPGGRAADAARRGNFHRIGQRL